MTSAATIKPQFRVVDGVRIRYAESNGPSESTLLLTSPWPESIYAFAGVWSSLADQARLVAIDLPGFGASEARDDLFSPRAMGEFVAAFIAEVDLGRPHIVGPDVGTYETLAPVISQQLNRKEDSCHPRSSSSTAPSPNQRAGTASSSRWRVPATR